MTNQFKYVSRYTYHIEVFFGFDFLTCSKQVSAFRENFPQSIDDRRCLAVSDLDLLSIIF